METSRFVTGLAYKVSGSSLPFFNCEFSGALGVTMGFTHPLLARLLFLWELRAIMVQEEKLHLVVAFCAVQFLLPSPLQAPRQSKVYWLQF